MTWILHHVGIVPLRFWSLRLTQLHHTKLLWIPLFLPQPKDDLFYSDVVIGEASEVHFNHCHVYGRNVKGVCDVLRVFHVVRSGCKEWLFEFLEPS